MIPGLLSARSRPGFTYLLSSDPNVYAYSLFKMRSSSTIAADLRRADNVTSTSGFAGAGCDIPALSSFASGQNVFVSGLRDQGTNGANATQSTQANQGKIWDSTLGLATSNARSAVILDSTDFWTTTLPAMPNATVVWSTSAGTFFVGANIPAGTFPIGSSNALGTFKPRGNFLAELIFPGAVNTTAIMDYLIRFGGGPIGFTGLTNLANAFRDATWITSWTNPLPSTVTTCSFAWANCRITSWNVALPSSCTIFTNAWQANRLTSWNVAIPGSTATLSSAWQGNLLMSFSSALPASVTSVASAWASNQLVSWAIQMPPSLTSASSAWNSNTTLTTVGANLFNPCTCTNYANAFTNTNLTQTSIDNILVSINSNGTSNGTFNQSGGSAPSATGQAAITAMRSRGWTVTVTGGF